MGVTQTYTTMGIKRSTWERLGKLLEEEQKMGRYVGFAPTTWVNILLEEMATHRENLKKYGPFLNFVGPQDNLLLVYDYIAQTTIEVEVHDDKKSLYCRTHKSKDCLHVGFCFAIPEVYRMLIERGFKQPR